MMEENEENKTPVAAEEDHTEETKNEEVKPEAEAPEEVKNPEASAAASAIAAADKPEEEKSETSEPKPETKADDISGTYNGTDKPSDPKSPTYFHKINYSNDGTISIDEQMENLRAGYAKKLGKSRIFDVISIVLMLSAFVAVLLLMFLRNENTPNWVTWVVLVIALVVIIGAFVLSTVFNKKNAAVAKEYLGAYEELLNGFVLSDMNVEDAKICVDAKIEDKQIIEAHYFKVINKIESRAIVEGSRNSYGFTLGEVAVVIPPVKISDCNKKPEDLLELDGTAYIPSPVENTLTGTQEVPAKDMTLVDLKLNEELNGKDAKKKSKDEQKAQANASDEVSSGLFGKYYAYDRSVKSEESVIITFMGSKEYTVLPDYTTGFKALHVPGLRSNIVVYAADPKESAKFFDEQGVALLNAITPNMTVQSLFISLNSYGSKCGIMLSDDIMQLPIKKLGSLGAYDAYKEATDKAFAFIDYADDKSASASLPKADDDAVVIEGK